MSNTAVNFGALPTPQTEPQLWDSNSLFSSEVPTKGFFEQYGISGSSTVRTAKGMVPINRISKEDVLITHLGKSVRPIGLIHSTEPFDSPYAPDSLSVDNALSRKSNGSSIVVGRQASLKVKFTNSASHQDYFVGFDLSAIDRNFGFKKNKDTILIAPVFAQTEIIQLDELCIVCPSFAELAQACGLSFH